MIVALDSSVGFQDFTLAVHHKPRWTKLSIFDQIAMCDDIVREISTALVSTFGWTLKDVRAILRGYLAIAKQVSMREPSPEYVAIGKMT